MKTTLQEAKDLLADLNAAELEDRVLEADRLRPLVRSMLEQLIAYADVLEFKKEYIEEEMKVVPVLQGFDYSQVIGELCIKKSALPSTPNYVLSLGFTQWTSTIMPERNLDATPASISYDLGCVSLVSDQAYLAYLLKDMDIKDIDRWQRVRACVKHGREGWTIYPAHPHDDEASSMAFEADVDAALRERP